MNSSSDNRIFVDFLRELQVPFTEAYSLREFRNMPFQSLFGLGKLLNRYNVDSRGVKLASPTDIKQIPPPFIASTPKGLIIVTGIDDGERIDYLSHGVPESIPLDEFTEHWDGTLFQAFPKEESVEPFYHQHLRDIFFAKAKRVLLKVFGILLLLMLIAEAGIWRHASMLLVTAIDLAGLYISWLLLHKTLRIHNKHADRVCGVIQSGGCDKVLETKASTFFGIFSWSEVGFTYFSVSLMALLLFPACAPWLALINLCCLPFSFWSVWYQKYRARHWCTLCLIVQASLWCLFFSYLWGGYVSDGFNLLASAFSSASTAVSALTPAVILLLAYAFMLLSLNALMGFISKALNVAESSGSTSAST